MADETHEQKMQQLADQLEQAELEQQIKKAEQWTWAQEKNTEVTKTDIFQQQKSTIDTLIDVFSKGDSGSQPQIMYAPAAQEEKKPTNYILYVGLALAAYFLLRKRG